MVRFHVRNISVCPHPTTIWAKRQVSNASSRATSAQWRSLVSHTGFRQGEPDEAFQILMLADHLTSRLDEPAQTRGQPEQ